MKKTIKAIIAVTAAALVLTGCAEKNEQALCVGDSIIEESSSVTSENEKPETSTETKPEETFSTVSNVEKPATSTTSETSETTSSATTSSKPSTPEVEKPVSSTTTQETSKPSSQPVEEPVHNHTFTNDTCVKLAICTTCGATQGTLANHNYSNGTCTICGKNDPNYVKPHNCSTDGHVWGSSYTKVETETTEIVEYHDVASNGFDLNLAMKYFGRIPTLAEFDQAFGFPVNFGSSTTAVKTTAIKTTTKYFHDCTECGKSEQYDTTETVDPGTNWEFVGYFNQYYNTVWYDINNVPQSILDGYARDKADEDDWLANLAASM